jgi:SAM-dependent methyltransferase
VDRPYDVSQNSGIDVLPCLREWAAPLLRCPACGEGGLAGGREPGEVRCTACARRFSARRGVIDLLIDPHPVVAREGAAVSRLDRADVSAAGRLASLLPRLEAGELNESDLLEFPCLRHASEGLAQIREVLQRDPLAPGELVVDLGADHCWASGLFLHAGCRVIALDITDHLTLAPRGSHPFLCRLVADMNDIPVRNGQADVVWATAAVHHSWSLDRTFAEAARVLRPGGRLYFCCEPMPSWLRYPFGHFFGTTERDLGINENWLPRRRWLEAATRAGFEARVVLPTLDRKAVEKRLRARRLPGLLAPIAARILNLLQVSVRLLATRGDPHSQ